MYVYELVLSNRESDFQLISPSNLVCALVVFQQIKFMPSQLRTAKAAFYLISEIHVNGRTSARTMVFRMAVCNATYSVLLSREKSCPENILSSFL